MIADLDALAVVSCNGVGAAWCPLLLDIMAQPIGAIGHCVGWHMCPLLQNRARFFHTSGRGSRCTTSLKTGIDRGNKLSVHLNQKIIGLLEYGISEIEQHTKPRRFGSAPLDGSTAHLSARRCSACQT